MTRQVTDISILLGASAVQCTLFNIAKLRIQVILTTVLLGLLL